MNNKMDYKDRYNLMVEEIANELFDKEVFELSDEEEKQVISRAEQKTIDAEATLIDDAKERDFWSRFEK